MKFNFIYAVTLAMLCLIVGIMTITGVQSAKNLNNIKVENAKESNLDESNKNEEENNKIESSENNKSSENDKSNESKEETVSETCEETEIESDFRIHLPAEKPVIYVYSDVDDKYMEIALDTNNKITCEYPKRDEDGIWKIVAYKDGHIEDLNGKEYNYLYWEGQGEMNLDFSKGFCIKGEESREFLNKALDEIGLNRREANEFIVYWLPKLEVNEWNLISFQTDNYTDKYNLRVHPHYDNMLRVFMAFKPVENKIDIESQDLLELKSNFKREGLHIVEWGGTDGAKYQ